MKRVILLIAVIFLIGSLHAQTTDEKTKFRTGKLIIKWSPAHLFSHFSSLQLAVEHRVRNVGLQYDFGPVLNIGGVLNNVDKDKHGYKAKLHFRYYVATKRHWSVFIASEVGYNRVNYSGYRAYSVKSPDGYDYFQYTATPSTCREKNVALLAGARFNIYRFCIDFQVGAIGRSILFHNSSPGAQYTISDRYEKNYAFYNNNSRDAIEPTGSIRVCYIIR